MFISYILSACRQVTNMLQQKKICSYLIYSQHVDKSQICYSKRKYVHIKYTLSMESSHKYVIAKEKCSYVIYSHHVDKSQICYAKENMLISNIHSACRQVTNMLQQKKICSCRQVTNILQQKKICSYLIYSQHGVKSQICYNKRKYVHI